MRPEFKRLRIKQIDRALAPFVAARQSLRPQRGWLRAVREATGMTLRQVAARLNKAPSLVAKLEKGDSEPSGQWPACLLILRFGSFALPSNYKDFANAFEEWPTLVNQVDIGFNTFREINGFFRARFSIHSKFIIQFVDQPDLRTMILSR